MKLAKNTYPDGHASVDFQAFGPAATKDGDFANCLIADLGFFSQDEKDSSKYFHGAVVQSRKTGTWYAYFEWGRTGAKSVSYQFESGITKEDAMQIFAEKMHSKNDKRGVWTTVAGIKTLTCKPKKDCYLVRPQAKRATGLPDARTITCNEGAKVTAAPKVLEVGAKTPKVDQHTVDLLRALGLGAVTFTRSSMADASIPTQVAIDEARSILQAATIQVASIGGAVEDQVRDKELMDMTGLLYKRIPKVKVRNAPAKDWILSEQNIQVWRDDLDAFEGALYSNVETTEHGDPYDGMNIEMSWISPASDTGKFLYDWWPKATLNKHANMGDMEIVNAWTVHQPDGVQPFNDALSRVEASSVEYQPLHQPKRFDLDVDQQRAFERSNVAALLHASRSVNISGILRKRLLLPRDLKGVAINGALIGPGLYHADDILKACQYASLPNAMWSRGNGAITGRHAFMFVNDVILGNPYLAPDKYGYTDPPKGYHSIFAKGRDTPGNQKPTANLKNNEWVVYNQDRHRIRYLIEFREKNKKRFA